MNTVQVIGRFVDEHKRPVQGEISFVPDRIWVDHADETYPTMAPEGRLINGQFLVYLTRTDTEELPWYYTVTCPNGTFRIEITEDGPLLLKDLLPKRLA